MILPNRVKNTKKDAYERTIPYIVRHTQLLPRQFLFILNSIISTSIQETEKTAPQEISGKLVNSVVARSENFIVDQILDSYRLTWPDANIALQDVLKNLGGNVVSFSYMHAIYNRSEKHAYRKIEDFNGFLRMAAELGAVGRMIGGDSTQYATAVFEYSEPHKLIFTPDDTLCIHPVFTERYRVVVSQNTPENYRPVYPLGTDPNSPDDRLEDL